MIASEWIICKNLFTYESNYTRKCETTTCKPPQFNWTQTRKKSVGDRPLYLPQECKVPRNQEVTFNAHFKGQEPIVLGFKKVTC